MTKNNTARPQAEPTAAHADQRDRAARLRDTAGRFTKSQDREPEVVKPAVQPKPQGMVPSGTVPAPADAPDDAYALSVNDDSLGMHADRGAALIVAPEMPTGAGLAVFYLKGKAGPVIYDLTHGFRPEFASAFAPGSELMPLIEVVVPGTGQTGGLRADLVEKIHRVIGVYTPVEVAENLPPKLPKLPLMSKYPEGMGEQYVGDAGAYPLVRKGETVVYDPSRRDPTHGALCVMQWNNDTCSVMLTKFRRVGGQGAERWWVDPVNRPITGVRYTSDGPYSEDALREKIVGTVVGVLVPRREQDEPEQGESVPIGPAEPDETEATEDTNDSPALIESAASLDFTACDLDTPTRTAREWAERVSRHSIGLHLADRLLRMEKSEMAAFIAGFAAEGAETFGALLNTVRGAHEEMKGLAELMAAAEGRLFIAASSVALSSDSKEV